MAGAVRSWRAVRRSARGASDGPLRASEPRSSEGCPWAMGGPAASYPRANFWKVWASSRTPPRETPKVQVTSPTYMSPRESRHNVWGATK